MEGKKILGYRSFNSKKGVPCCILTLGCPYSDRDIQNGSCGTKVEEIWLPENCHNIVNPQIIGKMAVIDYYVMNGRAYVENVTIK